MIQFGIRNKTVDNDKQSNEVAPAHRLMQLNFFILRKPRKKKRQKKVPESTTIKPMYWLSVRIDIAIAAASSESMYQLRDLFFPTNSTQIEADDMAIIAKDSDKESVSISVV